MTDFGKAAVAALVDYLRTNVSGIAQVLSEWPSANIELNYPAISVTTKSAPFTPCDAYLASAGDIDMDANSAENLYIVGQYDLKLQVDIWARNKEERYTFYDLFFKAFNADITPMGLRLQLTDYYDRWISYTSVGYRFEDSQRGSQTEEWRAIVDIECSCDAIMSREDFIITQDVADSLTLELPSQPIP